jgi:hypothetical protein
MPTDPTEPLSSSYLSGNLGSRGAGEQRGREAEGQRGGEAEGQRSGEDIKLDEGKKTFSSDEVIPARGMMTNEKGQIVLTAYPTPNAGDRNAPESNYCTGELPKGELSTGELDLLRINSKKWSKSLSIKAFSDFKVQASVSFMW